MFIAGLALLASNHEWAKRWLSSIKKKGINLAEYVFVKHPVWEAFYDVATIVLVVVGVQILNSYTRNIMISVGVLLILFATFLFMGNRKRLQRAITHLNNKRKRL